jgi:Undecaprenyl-phosphate glucose phosphotransferase
VLYRYSEVFRTLMMAADLTVVAGAWLGAYWLRFHAGIASPLGIPNLQNYVLALGFILPLWWLLLRRRGLYEPRRLGSLLKETVDVLSVTGMGVVILLAASFFIRSYSFSRGMVLIFSVTSPLLIVALRVAVRTVLRQARARGYNQRFVLVVGAGRLAEEIIHRIHDHPQSGMQVHGVLADGCVGGNVRGVPVVGAYSDLKQALRQTDEPEPTRIDQVIIALPRDQWQLMDKILADLDDEIASVKLAPDLLHILTLRSSVESLDGLPVISLRESPLVGWASVQKRGFDLVGCSLALLGAIPVMAVVALAVWLSSGRPIFYVQRRMGLDGRVFRMYKFRTMQIDAESQGGAVWTRADDPRRTRLGAWLRRRSLDELPQLWNVLKGDMSLVGPRPERPILIEEFKREIPGYMLRHKVKSGMTGWAQVHGWRGDTSLHERIEHDIYYIQHWSLGLDVQILLMTLWSGLFSRNAY